MKTRLLAIAAAFILLTASSSNALILENGGFETGDFTGWTLDFGKVYPEQTIVWGQSDHGSAYHDVVNEDTPTPYNQKSRVPIFYEDHMARINTGGGDFHATKLSQTGTIEQKDIDESAKLYYTWGACMVEPTNDPHGEGNDFPFFGVDITVTDASGVTVKEEKSYYADATGATDPNSDWIMLSEGEVMWPGLGYEYPGNLFYQDGIWEFDISTYEAGDQITIEIFAADCGLGGHGGYAYIDGIGTRKLPLPVEKPVDTSVPEPATMFLLGCGLVGIGGFRRRFEK